jgi:hypothetical protein
MKQSFEEDEEEESVYTEMRRLWLCFTEHIMGDRRRGM